MKEPKPPSRIQIVIMSIILIVILMQNPFAISSVWDTGYKVAYGLVIILFLIIASIGEIRLPYLRCKRELTYYVAFCVLTIFCLALNGILVGRGEIGDSLRFLFRYLQFFIVFFSIAIIGTQKALRIGGRISLIFAILAIAHYTLNALNISNPFGDIQIASIDDAPFFWSIPFGFANFPLPIGDRIQEYSYFTEPANFGYFQLLFLIYYNHEYSIKRSLKTKFAIGILFFSLLTSSSVAAVATLLLIVVIPYIVSNLAKITIKGITIASIYLASLIILIFSISSFLINLNETALQFKGLSIVMRFLEWQQSVSIILSNPYGLGVGVFSPPGSQVLLENEVGFTKEYGGPTNFLLPFYQLGLPYVIPFIYLIKVLASSLKGCSAEQHDVRMTALMVLAGFIVSLSYMQLNTAVFQITLTLHFISKNNSTRKSQSTYNIIK